MRTTVAPQNREIKMFREFALSATALAVLSTSAFAADLPVKAPSPVFIPPPSFSWAGPYIGGTAGFARAHHHYDDLQGAFLGYPGFSDVRSDGFIGGGTLGVNFQNGSIVYGLETDFSWLSNETSYVDPNGNINSYYPSETNSLKTLGTVRGRLGLGVDRALVYFTAGLAYGEVNNSIQYNSFRFPTVGSPFNVPYYTVDATRVGWVVGGGLEYAVTQNWTVKGEALYVDLGTEDANWISLNPPNAQFFPGGANYNLRWDTTAVIVRAGINYKFDWLFPSPAVAGY